MKNVVLCAIYLYLWTVSVIKSDLPWKDVNARSIIVPLKTLSDQEWIRYQWCFCFFNLIIFILYFSAKRNCAFLAYKKHWWNSQKKILFDSEKRIECIFQIFDMIKVWMVPLWIEHWHRTWTVTCYFTDSPFKLI